MIKTDPIIAVQDVEKSSAWYQDLFQCKNIHGGSEFDVLVDDNNQVILCLHRWGAHEHPTLKDNTIEAGNGLILYFRTNNIDEIRERARELMLTVELEIEVNPNSGKREFSLRDPDGYYLTIAEYHQYQG